MLQRTALSFCCILFQGFRAAPSKRPLVSSYRKLDYARQVSRYAVQRHHDYRRSPPTGSSNTLEKRIPPRPFVRKTRLGSNIEFCFELLLHRDFVSRAHPSSFPSFLALSSLYTISFSFAAMQATRRAAAQLVTKPVVNVGFERVEVFTGSLGVHYDVLVNFRFCAV